MSWWPFGTSRPLLTDTQAQQLRRWQAITLPHAKLGLDGARFIVLDTETSGLDHRKDRLLSIGAVVVQSSTIEIGEVFDCVLRQATPSGQDNILIHGIGGTQQLEGEPPVPALLRFLAFAKKDPIVAFHAGFDQHFVDRALKRHLGYTSASTWLDLALLLPALFREVPGTHLDDWLAHFGIIPAQRHSALGDAAATAQLLLIALSEARVQGLLNLRALRKRAAQLRWLQR